MSEPCKLAKNYKIFLKLYLNYGLNGERSKNCPFRGSYE